VDGKREKSAINVQKIALCRVELPPKANVLGNSPVVLKVLGRPPDGFSYSILEKGGFLRK